MTTSNLVASVQARTPEERSTQFAAGAPTPQTSDAGTFLVIAYVLMWAVTLLFIVHTWRRARGIAVRMEELRTALAQRRAEGAAR